MLFGDGNNRCDSSYAQGPVGLLVSIVSIFLSFALMVAFPIFVMIAAISVAAVMVTIPVVALFILFQRKMVVGGLTQGAVKG